MYDMMIRKKALKIQERLGMRIGISNGTSRIPVVKTREQTLHVLNELYKIGLKAFVLPKELFSGITTTADLYKTSYGELLKIREEAKRYNIELSLHHPSLPEQPDETLKIFCNISSIMDCRTFITRPDFYKMMPQDQALKLTVYTVNEVINNLRVKAKIGVETTGRTGELGSLEDVIDIVKRTAETEPIVNWAHVHARGSGALREQIDFRRVMDSVRQSIGQGWLQDAYFLFSGISYGPSGEIKHIPYSQSDMKLEYLIKEIMSLGIKGTLIFEDPGRERFILDMLETLGDMVR